MGAGGCVAVHRESLRWDKWEGASLRSFPDQPPFLRLLQGLGGTAVSLSSTTEHLPSRVGHLEGFLEEEGL